MKSRLLLSLAALLFLPACNAEEHIRDLGEVAIFRVGVGPGIRASVRAGALLHTGAGVSMGGEWMWCHGYRKDLHVELDVLAAHLESSGFDIYGPRHCQCFAIVPPLSQEWMPERESPTSTKVPERYPYAWIQAGDIEVSVWLGLFGFGIGISFGELIDFVTNLFGLDLDPDWENYKPLPPREPPPDRSKAARLAAGESWRWEDIDDLSEFVDETGGFLFDAESHLNGGDAPRAVGSLSNCFRWLDPLFDKSWPEPEAATLDDLKAALEATQSAISSGDIGTARDRIREARAILGRFFRAR